MREITRLALDQGWQVDKTQKGHIRFRSPRGGIAISSGTPSDWRALLNFKSVLRRLGLQLKAA